MTTAEHQMVVFHHDVLMTNAKRLTAAIHQPVLTMTMEQLMMMLQKHVREINERELMISAVHQDVRHMMNTGSNILHGVRVSQIGGWNVPPDIFLDERETRNLLAKTYHNFMQTTDPLQSSMRTGGSTLTRSSRTSSPGFVRYRWSTSTSKHAVGRNSMR
jgi:hypothetical protein